MTLTAADVRAIVREEIERATGKSPEPEPEILSRKKVAELLDIEEHTVTRWVKKKGLPGYKLPGGDWRFERSAVLEWLRRQGK